MARILVAPLDWGLGHATRCIPVIRLLARLGYDVVLAGSGDSLTLLNEEFPKLPSFVLPGYEPYYAASRAMSWKMFIQLPKFISTIRREHTELQDIVAREKINAVISDNRYGCWSPTILSIFITHQTNIKLPLALYGLKGIVRALNVRAIGRFDQCWIPDKNGPQNLSGSLTNIKGLDPAKVKYVGNLSRFDALVGSEVVYDVAFVLSGPEPQRTILENIILAQVELTGLRYFIVRGIVTGGRPLPGNISYADFLSTRSLLNLIMRSTCVVARSGYSTIMDLAKLGKKAIFIPTPGQTEQEYLAKRLMKMKIAYYMPQHLFDLERALKASDAFTGFAASLTRFDLLEENVVKNLTILPATEDLNSNQSPA